MTFRNLAESQVTSPEHLRIDTVLLYTEGHAAALIYIQQEKTLSVRVLSVPQNTVSLTI